MRLSQSEEEIVSSLAFCIVQDVRNYIAGHQDEYEQWLTEQNKIVPQRGESE